MSLGLRIFVLLLWLYIIFVSALLLFAKGFLLKRVVVDNSSVCHKDNWMVGNLWNGISARIQVHQKPQPVCSRMLRPKFNKAILVIIDGLRYDFLQYDNNLDSSTTLPFQNKMKKLHHILNEEPGRGKLYKFEADPPTTTMQRIKGMTTGSLPTFIDAGTNFDSYQITEDNILDHALRKGMNISFMGCSTWTELFPNQFHRKIPFSALNVKDLDTIDYGIIKHLIPEVKRTDWSILIAHFLGVDHCGHRYGTHHPEMSRKLNEMDNVIRDLVENIDDETLLLVMGDHGMTISGDHGGDSQDEVMAGLFAYSKKKLFSSSQNSHELPQVSQIDIVPTLSLLLDLPIPFSNLGSVIPDFFTGDYNEFLPTFIHNQLSENRKLKNDTIFIANVFKEINHAYVSYLNCKQILSYVSQYETVSGDLPVERIEAVRTTFEFLEEKFDEFLDGLVTINWSDNEILSGKRTEIEELVQDLQHIRNSFQDVLQHVKNICQSVWAKFDLVSISMGVSLMLFIAIIVIVTPYFMTDTNLIESRFIYLCGFSLCLVGGFYLAQSSEYAESASLYVFVATSFSFSLWLFSSGVHVAFASAHKLLLVWRQYKLSLFVLLCFGVYLTQLFANSFIIYEDSVTLFYCQSFILVYSMHQILSMLRDHKSSNAMKSSQSFTTLKIKMLHCLFNNQSVLFYGVVMATMLSLRWTKYFWFCREMQLQCNISPYSLPLVSLLSEFTKGYAHERLLLALVAVLLLTGVTFAFIKKRGNLKGFGPSVFIMKYASITCGIAISLHWNLQLVQNDKLTMLFDVGYFQQIVLPRFVYFMFIVSLCSLVYNPLCLFVIHQHTQPESEHSNTIPGLYSQIKEKINGNIYGEREKKPPVVFGLRTLYSSSLIIFLYCFIMVVSLILTDGMSFPLLLIWCSGYWMCRLFSFHNAVLLSSYDKMFVSVITWVFFSSYGFYATGHQTTIPAIRFQSAYIGFKGSLPEIVPQVLVVILNTFSSQIVCTLALPLLFILGRLTPHTKPNNNESELDIFDHESDSRVNFFRMAVLYIGVLMLKVAVTASSAAIHRRHLMVWKIFAPRFLFEAACFLVTVPILLASFCYFLRVDNSLRRWMKRLQDVVTS
ncbi:GPI ethanolamine phosphate transferase 3-like [Hydractinia symbiolongicarpus]|uniref:GPI ethanolamine phosphate transferase 3-like n=1 Tax=Hydractinia symbiolongicarpus TaxID=13093 RepID=UPI00254E1460|nr:GPI ethanolamine phosphate transferase 3-like [Hydractinia symbiolongicarpus]